MVNFCFFFDTCNDGYSPSEDLPSLVVVLILYNLLFFFISFDSSLGAYIIIVFVGKEGEFWNSDRRV